MFQMLWSCSAATDPLELVGVSAASLSTGVLLGKPMPLAQLPLLLG